jgi:regulator of sigma E protease
MKLVYILAAILIFGVLIAVHEFGHFLTAKLCGVRVNEFSIGMGPLVWHKETEETQYSWRLLPIGGYCAMEGEDEDTGDQRSFVRQGFWKKLLILAAGSLMNFLAGVVILLVLYSGATAFYTDQISGFAPEFPLEGESGLMEGDVFYKIDGYRTYLRGDASIFLSYHRGDTIDIEVIRNGEKIVLKDFPMTRQTYSNSEGGTYTGFGLYVGTQVNEVNFLSRLQYTWYQALDFVQLVRFSLVQLVTGGASMEDLSGPVGIVSTITEVGTSAESASVAWKQIFYFAALLAVNLAVMNLLPIPALDGGRIFFLLVDAVSLLLFKRQVPEKYQAAVNTVGFVVLMGFMLLVTMQDVWKLIR